MREDSSWAAELQALVQFVFVFFVNGDVISEVSFTFVTFVSCLRVFSNLHCSVV